MTIETLANRIHPNYYKHIASLLVNNPRNNAEPFIDNSFNYCCIHCGSIRPINLVNLFIKVCHCDKPTCVRFTDEFGYMMRTHHTGVHALQFLSGYSINYGLVEEINDSKVNLIDLALVSPFFLKILDAIGEYKAGQRVGNGNNSKSVI